MKFKVFLAGSKELEKQRGIIRDQVMIWNSNNNLYSHGKNVEFCVYTYENFCESISNSKDSAQERKYNVFIRTRADVAMFILYGKIGDKTREEFDVAYESLSSNRKAPEIFVLSHKQSFGKEIEEIRKKLTDDKEYFTEYESDEDLKYKIPQILDKYVAHKLESIRKSRIKRLRYIFVFVFSVFVLCLGFNGYKIYEQKHVKALESAIERYENSPQKLGNYKNLRDAIKKYEKTGLSKEHEVYRKAIKY